MGGLREPHSARPASNAAGIAEMSRRAAALATALVVALVATAVGTGGSTGDARSWATTVTVRLDEWKVMPSVASVRAGKVTLVARNVGQVDHNLVVLRTNLAPRRLPTVGARAKEVGRVGKTPVFSPGQTRRLALNLKAGRYVLICNVPGHYKAGMFVGFRAR